MDGCSEKNQSHYGFDALDRRMAKVFPICHKEKASEMKGRRPGLQGRTEHYYQ
jgi:hypothetical protein